MKIKILDTKFLNENKDIPEIFDEEDAVANDYITLLEENSINYIYGNICPDCEQFHREEDLIYIEDKDYYVCQDCLYDNYFYCDDCNNWYSLDTNSYETENHTTICQDCRDSYYVECADCGLMVHENNCYYCEDCDRYYCYRCWDDHYHDDDDGLYSYHEFHDWQPTKTNDEPEPDFYIGHELEIDEGDDRREAARLINNEINAICMQDGSLSDSGIEIISHPLSYNYMLSKENNYRELFKQLTNNYNYRSHNTDTCGLHFHVTRPDNDTIDRIILFMETYKEEIINLSRRTSSELSSWANFLSDRRTTPNEKELKSLDYIKKNKETSYRYMALNLSNYRTIEYRFFKGTLKYETFMADFEFVYFLTKLAKDHTIPIEELTWEKVVNNGRFLKSYIDEHNLHSNKPIFDYTTEILIARNRQKEDMKKELHILYKKVISTIHDMTKIDNRKKVDFIDMNEFTVKSQWLDCIVRDTKNLDRYFDNNDECYIKDVENRIKYIKERMN